MLYICSDLKDTSPFLKLNFNKLNQSTKIVWKWANIVDQRLECDDEMKSMVVKLSFFRNIRQEFKSAKLYLKAKLEELWTKS